ncbi:MAG TPA: response regulator, partial [Bacteroidales bacterium]
METIPGNETPLNILVVEDNPGDVYIIKELLKSKGTKFALDHSSRLGDAIKMAGKKEFDVILLDLGLPDSVGLETLKKFKASQVKVPVVVMTGLDDEDVALTSVKVGAQDYLVKNNLTPENILRAIRYGIERKKNEEALQKLNEELESKIQIRTKELAETNNLLKMELDERKRAEEKLAESEEKYRLLFTEMIDGFALHEIITDNNGDPSDYRFVSINPAFEKMMGLKARDIIGKTVFDMMPVSGEKWIKIYSKVTLTGKSADFESYYSELDKYFKVSAFCPKT